MKNPSTKPSAAKTFRPATLADKKYFFVTGFPRSRTAWLANFLTYGGAFCYHDAVSIGGGVEPMIELLERAAPGYSAVGISDSSLAIFPEAFVKRYRNAAWVLVVRDQQAALESFVNYFAAHAYPGKPVVGAASAQILFDAWKRVLVRLPRLVPIGKLLTVSYGELELESVGRSIWYHCLPHIPFDAARWRMLNGLRVSVIAEKHQPPRL